MCAICGIINKNISVDSELLKKMTDIMEYRGPDESGFYIKDTIGLGHRRLKIIDLITGKQPLSNEDESIFLICNGEIYNFQELRKLLEEQEHKFRSKSDSEVILHLYEEKGIDCLNYLRGMFAFAIWDGKEKKLFLARDRIGKKPLVYCELPEGFIFASEIKALLLHPSVRKEIDPLAVDLFLTYQAVPSPGTIFKKIKKLPSAHYLIWQNGEIKEIKNYWDINFHQKIKLKSEYEYSDLLWSKLVESTKIRMIADVPLGVFLSGGIDSSTITGIMSSLSRRPVKTFSIGFNEKQFDELKYAKIVADRFATEHHQFIVRPDIMEILPKLIWHYNEPFADTSMIPTYYVARETKKYVTVALNGDGGDENLAGYTRYWQMILMKNIQFGTSIIPFVIKKWLIETLLDGYNRHPDSTFFRIWKWMDETEKYGDAYAYGRRLISFASEHKEEIYSNWFKSELHNTDALSPLRNFWEATKTLNLLEKMIYTDFHLYLADVLTVKMDIASMANSLETRSPFLDQQFVETIASFPPEIKFKRWTSKYILKKKLQGFLPEEILNREKMGFGLPIGEWFRKELKDYLCSYLLSDSFAKRNFFNPEAVKNIIYQHIEGKKNHTARLWNLLVFELWYRIFIEGESF
ncbi:MAG: asparagine synthase (glutamine-hydrolyzing) [bacterium]|nr:asparagine synthase (glutamine-hydrolyzing) [bacterium]